MPTRAGRPGVDAVIEGPDDVHVLVEVGTFKAVALRIEIPVPGLPQHLLALPRPRPGGHRGRTAEEHRGVREHVGSRGPDPPAYDGRHRLCPRPAEGLGQHPYPVAVRDARRSNRQYLWISSFSVSRRSEPGESFDRPQLGVEGRLSGDR